MSGAGHQNCTATPSYVSHICASAPCARHPDEYLGHIQFRRNADDDPRFEHWRSPVRPQFLAPFGTLPPCPGSGDACRRW